MNTYECPICYNINHVSRLHCGACGTIPPMYSGVSMKTLTIHTGVRGDIERVCDTVAANGCDRIERHRTVRRTLATVPADYYASID